MAQSRLYFLVGLFVTIGVMLGAAAVIWLGASKYFEKGGLYVAYFDESVQGLQNDSSVKYRGVDIGTVQRIEVAPDRRLVEVVMKIETKGFNVEGVAAKLSMAGLTGIVYVELDLKKPGEQAPKPAGFRPPYPVIPSTPSDVRQIESSINEALKRMREIDLAGISAQLIKTAKSIDSLVNSDQTRRIMRDADTAAVKLADASEKIDHFVSGESINNVIAQAGDAVVDARAVIREVKSDLERMKIAETADNVNRIVERAGPKVDATLTEVEATAQTLRRAADALEALVDRINADPSALIFSRPPKGE
jgi:phospholipid/cholesterol/gamma-HCH transport system substrate-binding protein